MPPAFLMEVLEWNEALEEARDSGASELPAALTELEPTWNDERAATLRKAIEQLTPFPERDAPCLANVRRDLNAVRYLDRALRELETLRLACDVLLRD